MFQILPCPSCQTYLKLPTTWLSLQGAVELRCPGCGKNVELKSLLSDSFPSWELISSTAVVADEEGASAALTHGGTEAVTAPPTSYQPTADGDVDDLELVSEPESSATGTPTKKQIDWSSFEPITHEQFERMKRKQRSPIWSMLQVVFGGFLAVPIALLILWYGLGRDVGDAGPTVAKYAPWIVPKKFQGRIAAKAQPLAIGNENQGVLSEAVVETYSVPNANADAEAEIVIGADSGVQATLDSSHLDDASQASGMINEAPSEGNADESQESSTVDTPSLDLPPIDLRTENVLRMIRECERDLKLWNESTSGELTGQSSLPTAEIRELAQRCYSELQALTNTITPIPKTQPYLQTIRTEMGGIGRAVKNFDSVQQLVQKGSQYWLSKSSDGGVYPLAIIVEIEQVDFADGGWKAVAKGEMSKLDIRVSRSLSAYVSAGQRLFMMGNVTRATNVDLPDTSNPQPSDEHSTTDKGASTAPLLFVAEYLHAM